jgi:predicted amidophosphoribosyltransferase
MKGETNMKCSECGKEIQNDKKLCKECQKRLLREKIIGANYDAIRVGKGKTIGDIL